MMARRGSWKKNQRAFRRLQNRFKAIPDHARKGARRALRISGREAVTIIRGDVPVDDGDLLNSVRWTFGDPPPGVLGANERPKPDGPIPQDLRISIFAGGRRAKHAHLVHNGTGPRVRKDGRSTGVMPPQPFFWPNIRSLRRRQRGRITRMAGKAIRDAVK